MVNEDMQEWIVDYVKRTQFDVAFLSDDTRFYDGKLAALYDVCRALGVDLEEETSNQ
ncbi:MAG: hypothetical protein ACRC5C_09625 [Bacilli bacterium]